MRQRHFVAFSPLDQLAPHPIRLRDRLNQERETRLRAVPLPPTLIA